MDVSVWNEGGVPECVSVEEGGIACGCVCLKGRGRGVCECVCG